ncbi:MAG TPA: tRNA (adenosine(37)-N6)-threonylcarbamoyltransferase complex ATPase subunit type 1 TsaE [Rhodanobacteraceae bacterium]|nr:tRNA (adenosine(37)-N6)-threonylcarbamoyltransferase complex ATPase subunit type 1 TsaE [Rhodanobacteraceae bacterium]
MTDRQAILRGASESDLVALAARLATRAARGGVIFLEGELGAGKTTFARALLRALGSTERIKSPTYSLIESYRLGQLNAHHLDLYRIARAEEIEWLGLAELIEPGVLLLVEWPERGAGSLPPPDLTLRLLVAGPARDLFVQAHGPRGNECLGALLGLDPIHAAQQVAMDFCPPG